MAENNSELPPEEKTRKPRKWLRRLAIVAVFFLILGWATNGPIARYSAHHFLLKGLASQGVDGTVEVTGSAANGLTLKEANFSGEQGIQKLKFDQLGVSYTPIGLFKKRIDRVHADGLELVIDLAKLPKSEDEKNPFDLDEVRKLLLKIDEFYRPIFIDIKNVDVRLLNNEEPVADIFLKELSHNSDTELTQLSGLQVANVQGRETPVQNIALHWTKDRLSLDHIALLSDITISDISLSAKPGTPLDAKAQLEFFETPFAFTAPTLEKFTLRQEEGALSFKRVADFIGLKEEISGQLIELDLMTNRLTGEASFKLRDLKYQDYQLKEADLAAGITDELARFKGSLRNEEALATIDAEISVKDATNFEALKGRLIHLTLDAPELSRFSPLAKQELPGGQLSLKATLPYGSSEFDADFEYRKGSFQETDLPTLIGKASMKENAVITDLVASDSHDSLKVQATYHLEEQLYTYALDGTLPIRSQLAKMMGALEIPKPLELTAKGKGNLKAQTHEAKGGLAGIIVNSESKLRTTVATRFEVDWPKSISIPNLGLDNSQGGIHGSLHWEDSRLNMEELKIADSKGQLLTIDGFLPLPLTTASVDDLLENESPMDLTLDADEFSLARLRDLIPALPAGITGRLDGRMKLGGTFARPNIDGTISGRQWVIEQAVGIKPLDFQLTSTTKKDQLIIDGIFREGGTGFATLKGGLPVTVTEWIRKEDAVSQTPISLKLMVKNLALERFKEALPQLNRVKGVANVDLSIAGTVAKPIFLGEARLDAERIRFDNDNFPDLRNSKLKVNFDTNMVTIAPSSFYGSGGEYQLSGTIDLETAEPVFNLKLAATRALIWRDDSLSLRSDADLRLTGTLAKASLTGNLGVSESLYYKDIEIIPFGVPAGTVPTPEVPTVDAPAGSSTIPVPDPYGSWTLDVALTTKDPILIRGNLAEGQLVAKGRIRGTIANPAITLDASLKDASAELPLSKLKIKKGDITLRPGEGFIPKLNIRGRSKVGGHQVFIYVYGRATSPKLVFTSNPPLPEAEVLTLLATGTTTSGLEDQQVASVKAFQLLLSEMRRKHGGPGGNKIVGKLLNTLDTVDLRVGDNDQFSGRRFNSATLQLSSKFYASAAFDNEGNSRGILIYSLRF